MLRRIDILISSACFSQGLSCLTNLQHLDLSNNHLARVTDIERCMLLQTFNLQANNLQEVRNWWFACDVTAAILVYRTMHSNVSCEFEAIIMQKLVEPFSIVLYTIQHGRLITWMQIKKFLSSEEHKENQISPDRHPRTRPPSSPSSPSSPIQMLIKKFNEFHDSVYSPFSS